MKKICFEVFISHRNAYEVLSFNQRFFANYEAAKAAASVMAWDIMRKEGKQNKSRRATMWKSYYTHNGIHLSHDAENDKFESYDISIRTIEVEG